MPKLLFVSEAFLQDVKSGAAHSARAMLQALAAAGWDCQAATMTVCDGDESSLAQLDTRLDPLTNAGNVIEIEDGAVKQNVYITNSTCHRVLRPWEMRDYQEMVRDVLARFKPDIVLTYSSELLRPLLAEAQQRGAKTVFYIANAAYAQREGFSFKFIDEYIVPSQAMAELYREKLAIEPLVVRDLVPQLFDGKLNLSLQRIASRGQRYVTMINPTPQKGGLLFLNIVAQAKVLAPHVKFRAVEGRWARSDWESKGVDVSALTNLEWLPVTNDMAKVYAEAALLLVPSLGYEASGRVVAEAMLAGVPVLAMKNGGITEQVNDGGILFDVPKGLGENVLAQPDKADVSQWMNFVKVLMEDDDIYSGAVKLALKASAIHHPQETQAGIVSVFERLLAKPALAGMPENSEVVYGLEKLRARMNKVREAANAMLDKSSASSKTQGVLDDEPYVEVIRISLAQPVIREAMQAIKSKDAERARAILEQYLRILPEDITALGLLAEVADQQEREHESRHLMARVVALAPGFMQGQQQLLRYLRSAGDAETALKHSFLLLERAPHQPRYMALHASLLVMANRYEEAIAVYRTFFKSHSGNAHDWMQYALALKTLGYQQEGVDANRKAIDMAPGNGSAWHALSNMKLAVFTDEDIKTMQTQLARDDISDEDRFNLHFTLGKAQEDKKSYEASFEHYAKANKIRHSQGDYDAAVIEDYVVQAKEVFTKEFFAERAGQGNPANDPIFVLGLHRAGSTLTEQILASHSQIEGTHELADMLRIGRDFISLGKNDHARKLNTLLLKSLQPLELFKLGQDYLDATKLQRKTTRAMFVDKMPANWMHAGLIHLVLPNAKIIDIRRQPMSAGFALFKMNFGKGVDHAYSQRDIARYYNAYADLMAHFDTVLPGRIHHLQYESLVENTDAEIRRLVEYCKLPFEENCLRYWETERAVQTPSSEQVRQPIYKSALEQWRNYEPWLTEMREIFGDV